MKVFVSTVGFMNIAYAATPVSVSVNTSYFDAILQASFAVQFVLFLLICMSIYSWAIIIHKFKQFGAMAEANEPFMAKFWKAKSLEDIYENLDHFQESALARLFKSGYLELQKIAESTMMRGPAQEGQSIPKLTGLDNLERALRKGTENEVARLEKRLSFLATTGSTCPFIGLFGTVWGIMNSFHQIGMTGSASLAVVAPGISEALITTAIGLVAAVPAVVFYNHFIARLKKEEIEFNNFSTDFLNIVKRNFFRE